MLWSGVVHKGVLSTMSDTYDGVSFFLKMINGS